MIRWLAFLITTFSLFFVWEMVQAKFFASMEGLPFWRATLQCLQATGGDLIISAIAFATAAVAAKTLRWPMRQRFAAPLLVFLLTALVITIAYELYATSSGKWTYAESMPTVAGVGLLPLLQWLAIPLLQVSIFRAIWEREQSR